MAKVKFDVSGVDPEDAQRGNVEPARPGIYQVQIKELNPGFSKKDDGKPDKSRPRLEVVARVLADKDGETEDVVGIGSTLWDYLSHSKASEWKMDSFLQAIGVSNKKKRKGTWDTDDHIDDIILVRVKADSNKDGDYRPKVAGYFPFDGGDDPDEVSDDELADEDDDSDDSDDSNGDDVMPDFESMKAAELKAYAKENSVSLTGLKKKDDVIEALITAWQEEHGEGDDDDDDDDDDWDDVFDD